MRMLRAGKVSATLIVIVAFVVGLLAMTLSTGESPMFVGSSFMAALADGDSQALAELSYGDGVTEEELVEMWEYTTHVAGLYFTFSYEITGETKPQDDTAIVTMEYVKNAGMSGSYPEKFQLPLKKVDGEWRVDVFSLSRDMYPGLPR